MLSTLSPRILTLLVLPCAIAWVSLPGCEEGTATTTPPGEGVVADPALTVQENQILAAVAAMRGRGDSATLAITHADGTPYLNFSNDGDDILANLPLAWLADNQMPAAREIFADAGASGADLPSPNASQMFPQYQCDMSDNPKHAARFAADILELVFAVGSNEELVFETDDD